MTLIKQSKPVCTVVVTVDADPEIMPDLEEHAAAGLKLFAQLNGFISGALHKSSDGARLIQYLQWSSMADHQACMSDPQWDHMPSARKFMKLVQSGKAKMDVRIYDVVAEVTRG